MRLSRLAICTLPLMGCAFTEEEVVPAATEIALVELAQNTALMPDCDTVHVRDALQTHPIDDLEGAVPTLTVQFVMSRDCIDDWKRRLQSSDWIAEHHGGYSSVQGDLIFVSSNPEEPTVMNVLWWEANRFDGVPDYVDSAPDDLVPLLKEHSDD